jgi:hypothetical protein
LLLKTLNKIAPTKKTYIRPEVSRVLLDFRISLVMMTDIPPNPDPTGPSGKSNNSPFQSPFGNKPFS